MDKRQRQSNYILLAITIALLANLVMIASLAQRRKNTTITDNQLKLLTESDEKIYWILWNTDLEHMKIRWTITTFFMGVSFGILGFSFQSHLVMTDGLAMRLSSILIYWFAYILFVYLRRFNQFIRSYQSEMEKSGRVSFNLQSSLDKTIHEKERKQGSSSNKLVLYFGILYTFGVILLSIIP